MKRLLHYTTTSHAANMGSTVRDLLIDRDLSDVRKNSSYIISM